MDALCIRDRVFQLLRQFRWLGLARRKRAHQLLQFFLRDARLKLDTRQSRRAQQLRKLLFCRRSFQRHTIQQQLRTGCAQQQPVVPIFWHRRAQFTPGDLQLFVGPGVLEPVQAGKLQQNV